METTNGAEPHSSAEMLRLAEVEHPITHEILGPANLRVEVRGDIPKFCSEDNVAADGLSMVIGRRRADGVRIRAFPYPHPQTEWGWLASPL